MLIKYYFSINPPKKPNTAPTAAPTTGPITGIKPPTVAPATAPFAAPSIAFEREPFISFYFRPKGSRPESPRLASTPPFVFAPFYFLWCFAPVGRDCRIKTLL